MKINPGPKGLLPWTDAEREEGQRLASMLSPAEVYLALTVTRAKRYEAALSDIASGLSVLNPYSVANEALGRAVTS